jgi:hypothetical protein
VSMKMRNTADSRRVGWVVSSRRGSHPRLVAPPRSHNASYVHLPPGAPPPGRQAALAVLGHAVRRRRGRRLGSAVLVDFASWVVDGDGEGLVLGNVDGAQPPGYAESV